MSTRASLFDLWSDDEGYGFFLGHNKMREQNSVNILMLLAMYPPEIEKVFPQYKEQDLPMTGTLGIQMLAMKPYEMFPFFFQSKKGLFEIRTPKGTFMVKNGQSIFSVLEEEYTFQDAVTNIFSKKIYYQLTLAEKAKIIFNSDAVNDSKVYAKIKKESSFSPAGYNVWDNPPETNEKKYYFYAKEPKNSKKEKRIKLNNNESQTKYDNRVTKWICQKMSTSEPYKVWLTMFRVNKRRAQEKAYATEKAEYLKSMLSWSLNVYVMLQNKRKNIPKLSYLDLQYADKELNSFIV